MVTGTAIAVLGLPKLAKSSAPPGTVSIVRCKTYGSEFTTQLSTAFDQIGGISSLVRGKTVALKLNLTGNPTSFPLTPELPYRTDPTSVAYTVHLLAKAGSKRVRLIESFPGGSRISVCGRATGLMSKRSIISEPWSNGRMCKISGSASSMFA